MASYVRFSLARPQKARGVRICRYDHANVFPTGPNVDDSARTSLAMVYRYHDGTKHDFQRFARSLGYLDWASQPRPFRGFAGAEVYPLYPTPGVAGGRRVAAARGPLTPSP